MIACYILYSPTIDKFYIGFTQNSVEERLEQHNKSLYGQRFTSIVNDWEVFLAIECKTISQAMNIEKHIKRMKSKKYIRNLKKYPGMREKLLSRFR